LGHVDHGIDAHNVTRIEGGALGTAHGLAHDLVHLLDGEAVLHHGVHGGHDGVHADAVGNEVGGVFAVDDALAKELAKASHAIHDLRLGLGTGHHLEEVHVTHGIEEVQHQEALTQGRGKHVI